MNYIEREKNDSSGIAKLLFRHIKIFKQNIWLITSVAIIGLIAGIFARQYTADTYFKEVLLKSSDNLHLKIAGDLLRRNRYGSQTINITNLTFENVNSQQLSIGGGITPFSILDLDIVKRAATGNAIKSQVLQSLSAKGSFAQKLAQKGLNGKDFSGRYRISNLKRGSKDILIQYSGKSIDEADIAIEAMLSTLRNFFVKRERSRITAAFNSRLQVLDYQIETLENITKKTKINGSATSAAGPAVEEEQKLPPYRADLAALKLDRENIAGFDIGNIDIQPFAVVLAEQGKNTNATRSKLWLVLTTMAGLLLGTILGYLRHGIRRLFGT